MHPLLWLNTIVIATFISIITIATITITIGWLDRIQVWRIRRPFLSRAPLWWIRSKWTVIQIYQKFTHRRYKK